MPPPFPAEFAGAGEVGQALLTTGNYYCDAVSPWGGRAPQGWPHTFLGTMNTVLMGLVTPENHGMGSVWQAGHTPRPSGCSS